MAGEPDDDPRAQDAPHDDLVDSEGDQFDEELDGDDDAAQSQAEAQVEAQAQAEVEDAAARVEWVILPPACTADGKGGPLAMGIQRWIAQELSRAGLRAAAPVFTMLTEHEGRQVPGLLMHREAWTEERIMEGVSRFANATKTVASELAVLTPTRISVRLRMFERSGEALTLQMEESREMDVPELPESLFNWTRELGARGGVSIEAQTWQDAAGTKDDQAMLSFLLGVGNLSVLQGRCVPAPSDQLLTPLMDAINRDAGFDAPMEALHAMVDILVQGQPDRASIPLSIQALSIAAQRRKTDPEAWHHLALLTRQLGDLPTSIQSFNQAFNLTPTNPRVAANFIQTLRRAGDDDNALKVAKFAVESGCEAPAIVAMLGGLLIAHDEFDTAEPFLRQAIEGGQVPSAYGDLANVLWDRGDSESESGREDREEALGLLRTAIEQKQVAKSTLDMLLDLHEEESLEEASRLLTTAAEKHPDNAAVMSTVANLYLDGDDPQRARPYLQNILKNRRRSLDDDAFARRSLLALDIEDFEDRYDAALAGIDKRDAAVHAATARFMREVIARDDRFWQPHLLLAVSVRESDGDDASLAHLQRAAQLRPNDPKTRELLAAIHRKHGRPRDAVDHLRVLVSLRPRDVQPVVDLASCMRDANLFGEARAVCQAALGMMPNHPDFTKILAGLPPAPEQQN